jgi:hypothetical protein
MEAQTIQGESWILKLSEAPRMKIVRYNDVVPKVVNKFRLARPH